jgi:serine/threonine protein kinase
MAVHKRPENVSLARGTYRYAPPEFLDMCVRKHFGNINDTAAPPTPGLNTYACDAWCFAMTMWMTLAGRPALKGSTLLEIRQSQKEFIAKHDSAVNYSKFDPDTRRLLSGLLRCDPTRRIGMHEVFIGMNEMKASV